MTQPISVKHAIILTSTKDNGEGRRAKQESIRSIIAARKPHQRRDSVFPGTRVLLLLSDQLKQVEGQDIADLLDDTQESIPLLPVETDVLYEGIVEEVVTKEKTHPLGIKVRAVGGKSGRVAAVLSTADDALKVAVSLGVEFVLPVAKNRGIRTNILSASSAGSKGWTPYSISGDVWVPKGPSAKAAAKLAAMGLLDDDKDSGSARGRGKRTGKRNYGEAGATRMRRAVEEQDRENPEP